MNETIFSRRVFLKGSTIIAASAALSACGGSSSTNTSHPYGYQVITNGSLTIELGSLSSYSPIGFGSDYIVEARFRITNNGKSPITLTTDNFTAKFDKKDAPVWNPNSIPTKSDFPYLFDQMPIPSGESRKGYVLFRVFNNSVSDDYDDYEITITCPESTATFAPEKKDNEWYE